MKGAARNVDGFSIELEPLAASADSACRRNCRRRRIPAKAAPSPRANAGTDAAASRPHGFGNAVRVYLLRANQGGGVPLASGGAERLHGLPLRADAEDRSLNQIPRNTLKVSVEPFSRERLFTSPENPPKRNASTSLQNLLCIPKACSQFSGTNGLWSKAIKKRG